MFIIEIDNNRPWTQYKRLSRICDSSNYISGPLAVAGSISWPRPIFPEITAQGFVARVALVPQNYILHNLPVSMSETNLITHKKQEQIQWTYRSRSNLSGQRSINRSRNFKYDDFKITYYFAAFEWRGLRNDKEVPLYSFSLLLNIFAFKYCGAFDL